jgi:hypothetical protein
VPGRIIVAVGDDRLWQPLADVALAAGTRGAQLVDRQPGGHGGHERARRCDLPAPVKRVMDSQQRFLDHVLGLGHAARQSTRDPQQRKLRNPQLQLRHHSRDKHAPAVRPPTESPAANCSCLAGTVPGRWLTPIPTARRQNQTDVDHQLGVLVGLGSRDPDPQAVRGGGEVLDCQRDEL